MSAATSTEWKESLSVEETNALRASLGLKPLQIDNDTREDDGRIAPGTSTEENDVLVAPVLPGAKKKTEEIRTKLETKKEKRLLSTKLAKVRALGEDGDDDDSAAAWIQKSRKLSVKQAAAKKARELLEMDNAIAGDSSSSVQEYTSADLKGLTVLHDADDFTDGNIVLTLADSNVLDDSTGDALESIDMVADMKHKKRVEAKTGSSEYKGTDDAEFEQPGVKVASSMLNKYDGIDQLTGDVDPNQDRKSFTIGEEPSVSELREREAAEIRENLKRPVLNLDVAKSKEEDFFTASEMAKFKKKRKKPKKLKSSTSAIVEASIQSGDSGTSALDRGSRSNRDVEERPPESAPATAPEAVVQGLGQLVDDEAESDDYLAGIDDIGDDEEERLVQAELQASLARARRTKRKGELAASAVAALGESGVGGGGEAAVDTAPVASGADGLIFSPMSEFVSGVGVGRSADAVSTPSHARNPESEQSDAGPTTDIMDVDAGLQAGTGELDSSGRHVSTDMSTPLSAEAYHEEESVGVGIMAALEFSKRRGFLEAKDEPSSKKPRTNGSGSKDASVKDSSRDRDRRDRDRDRDSRRSTSSSDSFTLQGYKPKIELEYFDDGGRKLTNEKEAFRYLSHKFHGKGSGKKKTEQRLIKLQEEELSKKMLAGDTPLGMTAMLRAKQEEHGSAFIVMNNNSQLQNLKKGKKH